MKLQRSISSARSAAAGVYLVECLVYIAILAVILGLGFAAFYKCWDNSKALRYAADDIATTLSAGEHWRQDIRKATGKISVETAPDGEIIRIPHATNDVLYAFSGGEVQRKVSSANSWVVLLSKVKASRMEAENRGGMNAWLWELELSPRRAKSRLRPLFTFEAVTTAKP